MGDKRFMRKGKSVDEALSKIPLTWNEIKLKATITVYKGNKSYERLFYTRLLRRIFANKLTRLMWAKRLEFFLK